MRSLACQPCGKRKVRCDRQKPCANCIRRKTTESCNYYSVTPQDRIAKLEAYVRKLGGNPDRDEDSGKPYTPSGSPSTYTPNAGCDEHMRPQSEPTLVSEDGESVYVESRAWLGWNGKTSLSASRPNGSQPFRARDEERPEAFSYIWPRKASLHFAVELPEASVAHHLWSSYYHNVDPLLKISFKTELEKLHDAATSLDPDLSDSEYAFIFSLYFVTIASFSEDECLNLTGHSRRESLRHFQKLSEHALARSGILGPSDLTTVEALALYIAAGSHCISPKGLWSVMGIVMRNAERLGLHRDGSFLGLPPYQTERRRRVWWQLQQLDIGLAIWAATSSVTLHADWDVKLPLNIEDGDLSVEAQYFPHEREGITSMSFCLWRYWVLREQRGYRRADGTPIGLAWPSDNSLSHDFKVERIDQLESSLKAQFLQHCDPIKPLDLLVQLSARTLLCTLRGLVLHPVAYGGDGRYRSRVIELSMQFLQYTNTAKTTPSLQRFRLRTERFIAWPQFAHILHANVHFNSQDEAARYWEVLVETYFAFSDLFYLSDDPRKVHAAELMISASNSPQHARLLATRTDIATCISRLQSALGEDSIHREQLTRPIIAASKPSHLQDPPEVFEPGRSRGQTSDNINHTPVAVAEEHEYDSIDWNFWLGFDADN